MAGMGPTPKADGQRVRRNRTLPMTRLPAEGRSGRSPKWPLPPDARMSAILSKVEGEREILAAQIDADIAPKGSHARLTRLDEQVAILTAQIKAATKMEKDLWRELWTTPQAVAWERMRWTREVAQYVRWKVLAELGDLDAGKEARQLADRLGLNPMAMLRLRWEIAADELDEKRDTTPKPDRRLRAVE